MVPNGWEEKRLGKVAEFQRGFDLPSAKRLDGNIPIISSSGVSGFHNESKVKAPGIVTGRYGTIGNVFLINEDFWPLNTSLWVKDFHQNEIKFIYYLLQSFDFKKFSDKTGVPGVNRNDLHAVKVKVPPLPEQQKIAKILTTWDKAIDTTERLIDNSKQQKKALMQQLLTGKKRLLDENGKRFEGEWFKTDLKELLKEVSARNKDESIERVLSVTNHSGFVLPEDQFSKRIASKNTSNYKVVKKGQFGYNPSRLNVGSFARLEDYEEGLLSPMYVIFSVIENKLDSDYFLQWMHSHEANQRIKNSTQGSVRESVNFSALTSISLKLPPLEEQQKIAAVLTNADKEIELLEQQLADLQQEKKALMQQLLTGKKRVTVD